MRALITSVLGGCYLVVIVCVILMAAGCAKEPERRCSQQFDIVEVR
jgi:hypothetical protein